MILVPEIDMLRARRWLESLQDRGDGRLPGPAAYELVLGASTIELVERRGDAMGSLVRFRYVRSRSTWRAQRRVTGGRYSAIDGLGPTPYLAELLDEVGARLSAGRLPSPRADLDDGRS